MRRAGRIRLTAAGALLTCGWLAVGTIAYLRWQKAEAPGAPAASMPWPALEAALLVALIFRAVAGTVYGLVLWVVTGRGPQA